MSEDEAWLAGTIWLLVAAEAESVAPSTSAAAIANFAVVSMTVSPDEAAARRVRSTDIQKTADRRSLFPVGNDRRGDPDNVFINAV
jgi:hypothetical protein